MTRCIIVVTIGRSGSSALAGALHHGGVPFGEPKELVAASRTFNPLGHWELREWRDAGLNIARCVRGGLQPEYGDLNTLVRLINNRNDRYPALWGVKATTMAYVLPFLMPHLPTDTRLVVIHRRFDGAVQSHMQHMDYGNGAGQACAELYVSQSLARMYGTLGALAYLPQHHVQFESLTANPSGVLAAVLDFCFDGKSPVTPQQVADAAAFIDPALRHH